MGGKRAASPDVLMRARFSAYAMGAGDFVIQTTDPTGPMWEADRDHWMESINDFSTGTVFEKVEILNIGGREGDGVFHYVTFKAYLRKGLQDVSFVERSRFTQVKGAWLYHSGETP